MSYLSSNSRLVSFGGKYIGMADIPSENPAISKMQNFMTAIYIFQAEQDRLPVSQSELSEFMNFDPDVNYTYTYTDVDTSIGYFQCKSVSPYVHSFTRTVSMNGGIINDIICKKLGTVAPGPADYISGILSCQIGTEQI